MKEWPLVLFTLATQLSCGLTLAATVFEMKVQTSDTELMRPLAMAIFPLTAMGILASMAHLGRPLTSWRALANLRRSRLSREVMLTAVFALLALAYSGFWWMGRTEGRLVLGAATGLAGISAVLAAAVIYTVPTRPVWNSGWLPASFLGTAVLLGGLASALLIPWRGNTGLLRVFLSAAVAGSALLLIAALWMAASLSRRADDSFTRIRLASLWQSLKAEKSMWMVCHVALVSLLPAAIAFLLWPAGRIGIPSLAGPVFAAVVCGSAIGRALMYWVGTRYEPF